MADINEFDSESFGEPEQLVAKEYFVIVYHPAPTVPVELRPERRGGSFRNFTRRIGPGEGFWKL